MTGGDRSIEVAGAPDGATVEDLLRACAPQVLGTVARRFGDFAAADDAVQEALVEASLRWPSDGVPRNPRGWLIQVAARRMTDQIRSEQARRRREELAARRDATTASAATAVASGAVEAAALAAAVVGDDVEDVDDTLALLFLCCHPALTRSSAVALTLRAVGGLTTAEIARAFMVPETTMAHRISRAKRTITASGIPFRLPTDGERPERLAAVLRVLYLVFNEGHTASAGADLQRTDLADEAIRLTRLLHGLLPEDGEVAGLLALMLLTDARRTARTGPDGELIPLAEQDRSLWHHDRITEGLALATAAFDHSRGRLGEYQLQAAIAALHDQAPSTEATDWARIATLYQLLEGLTGNPLVTLNRAVAVAMVHGPEAGMQLLDPLDDQLGSHHRLDAVRAHLHERRGDTAAAVAHYRAAAERTTSLPERRYLLRQAARLGA